MDTEEHLEIQKAISEGKPATDEGPYYHESWWESYKGGVKGKLGGAVIGAAIGAAMGVIAAVAISFAVTGGITLAAGLGLAASFAAGGMLYGAHEFGDVGKVTGAVASAHEKSEERMKEFENGKFAQVKSDINELKQMIAGKSTTPGTQPAASSPATPADKESHANSENPPHRMQHCSEGHCEPEKRQLVFWKIALIGLGVGLAAGAILAFGGGAEHILSAFGGIAGESMSKAGVLAASMTTMGLFGASFGINRDIFREIFDKTDLMFKGLIGHGKEPVQETSVAKEAAPEPVAPEVTNTQITKREQSNTISTIIYDSPSDRQISDTYHRDRILASAKQALLSMDHTKSISH